MQGRACSRSRSAVSRGGAVMQEQQWWMERVRRRRERSGAGGKEGMVKVRRERMGEVRMRGWVVRHLSTSLRRERIGSC